jgi:hypothetical protein
VLDIYIYDISHLRVNASKCSIKVSRPVETYRPLLLQDFVKHFYTEFYGNLINGLAADTRSETDGQKDTRMRKMKWPQHKQILISQTTLTLLELLYWCCVLNCVTDKVERTSEHVFEFRSP